MVDAPCGDFNWMQVVMPELEISYNGFDIVPGVIDENIANHSSDRVSFAVANICEDELPDCDLLMVRDCLFHLSFEDIDQFFKNIERVNYRYLLTTTHAVSAGHVNSDIPSGSFRLIDLFAHPFNISEENLVDRIDDYPEGQDKTREMILIEKQHVPTALQRPFTLAQ